MDIFLWKPSHRDFIPRSLNIYFLLFHFTPRLIKESIQLIISCIWYLLLLDSSLRLFPISKWELLRLHYQIDFNFWVWWFCTHDSLRICEICHITLTLSLVRWKEVGKKNWRRKKLESKKWVLVWCVVRKDEKIEWNFYLFSHSLLDVVEKERKKTKS